MKQACGGHNERVYLQSGAPYKQMEIGTAIQHNATYDSQRVGINDSPSDFDDFSNVLKSVNTRLLRRQLLLPPL